jgi:hypothetical protein
MAKVHADKIAAFDMSVVIIEEGMKNGMQAFIS